MCAPAADRLRHLFNRGLNVKRKLLVTALALACASQAEATCFVNQAASGLNDGSSWTDAYVDLQSAVKSTACPEIWVAEGVYKPAVSGEQFTAFVLKPDTALYGGFAGTETALEERNLSLHASIVSGDIDDNDANFATDQIDKTAADISGYNSRYLIEMNGFSGPPITRATVVDGFTITGASYSALFCNGSYYSTSECSPTLRNLTFTGNSSTNKGAAIYIGASHGGASRPLISNSIFKGNSSQDGGAIFVDSQYRGVSTLTLDHVVFDANVATHRGGAIYLDAEVGGNQNMLELNQTRFTNNTSTAAGGAIYAEINDSGSLEMDVAGSTFDSNSGLFGGAIYADANIAQLVEKFTNSTFDANHAVYEGGAISLSSQYSTAMSTHSFNNVTFSANRVVGDGVTDGTGGAIDVYTYPSMTGAAVFVTNTIFSGDTATNLTDGPEIHNSGGSAVVTIDHSILTSPCPEASTCTNVSYADPLLDPLGYFFGRTPVMRPGIGGSAIDAGDDATCEANDQRGFARPQGAHCDIGAVEMRMPSDDISFPGGF
jgi:predicted outer membrane repeat protein